MKFRRLFRFPWRTTRQIDADVEDELSFHIESRVGELTIQGLSARDARAQAEREFGDLDDARTYITSIDRNTESVRRRSETMNDFIHDLKYGVRKLLSAPSFGVTVVLTLALGIGASTAIFSVVDQVLLQPLPFGQADRLTRIVFKTAGQGDAGTPMDLIDYRTQASSFEGFSIIETQTSNLVLPNGEPERAAGMRVSANHFRTLRTKPLYGRFFVDGEDKPGAPEVVVLTEELWSRAFGADPKVVGTTVRVNGEPAQIIGIARAGERYPLSGELFLTRRYSARELDDNSRGARWLSLLGRVKDGVSVEQADRQVTQISEAMEKRFPEMFRQRRASAVQVQEFSFSDVRRPLYVMLAATGLVLLIACANVANLMLVRGTSREGELAIRAALGAGSGRLVRQLIAESLALTTLGAIAGVGLARLGMAGVLQMAPPALLLRASPSLDVRALALSAVAAMVTAFVFGILPAAQIKRADLSHALRSGSRGSRSTHTANRVRRMIIGAEVALAVMLLSGAGVLLRSFQRLTEVDPGFVPENVLVTKMVVPQQGYETPEKKLAFLAQLMQKLEAIPGALQVGVTDFMPLDGGSMNNSFTVQGRAPVRPSDEPASELRRVTPGFLATIGVPLLKGRMLNADDHATAPWVLVVNEAFVKQNFPTEDPIGKALNLSFGNPNEPVSVIVGVVGDVKHSGLNDDAEATIYIPYAQHPVGRMQVAVRSAVPSASLSLAVRKAVKELDGTIPLFGMRPMEEVVYGSIGRQKFIAVLIGIFAAVALVLAAVGLYGVISYGVSQRTHELGVRVALGATSERVSGMIVREGLTVTAAGLVLGLGAAVLSSGVLKSLLYEVKPNDPITLAAVATVLVLVAALASWLPARRAARVDPIIAMRGD